MPAHRLTTLTTTLVQLWLERKDVRRGALGLMLGLALVGGTAWGASKIAEAQTTGGASICPGNPVTVPNANVELVPIGPNNGRPGQCVVPHKIVLHTTQDPKNLTADAIQQFFAGSQNQFHVDSHFIVGPDGKIVQTVTMTDQQVEDAYAVANYADQVSIEMVSATDFTSKSAVPAPQYAATYGLVKFLMQQYKIGLSDKDCNWTTASDAFDPTVPVGIYGHYQLNPQTKTDPGKGLLCDVLSDIKNNTGPDTTSTAAVSTTSGTPGRLVPYDAYARPYSWPMTGVILQPYGFTPEAQNLGARYPDLYPKGDPGVIFSTTNHTEPPPNPKNDKYINPNIDIEPSNTDASARAVYATHAGWLTYADWAGEGKGYTVQIESDVEGDGQSDYATRYMHLQAPYKGDDGNMYFAPDIPLFHPATSSTENPTTTGTCSDPQNNDWKNVNKWDSQVLAGIAEVQKVEGAAPVCNLVKAFMQQESGGDENALSPQGYVGLMQVADNSVAGGGSNCDWQKYDIHTVQGNIDCGVQEITRGYKSCSNSWDAAIRKYFTGSCTGGGTDATGTSADQYVQGVKSKWDYLNSQAATSAPPAVPPASSQPAASAATSAANAATAVAAQLPSPYFLEAEAMDKSSSQLQTRPDSTASNGQMVAFQANGALAKVLNQKADRITILARGDQCAVLPGTDGSPEMVVSEDGTVIKKFNVTTTTGWGQYTLNTSDGIKFDGAQHTFSIAYDNDAMGLGCDRNLYVDVTQFIILNPNTPTSQTLSSTSIEVENLKNLTGSPQVPEVRSDDTASNKKYVLFKANGKAEDKVTIKDGNWIIVRAKGDQCPDGAPHMSVKIDGQEVLATDVESTDWKDYSTSFKLAPVNGGDGADANLHDVSVEFTNDEYKPLVCDRNLYADVITIQNNTTTQTTTNGNSLIGKTKYVAYNQLIGYVSNDRAHEKTGIDLSKVPDANKSYLSYRIMYNNPNSTTFPSPDEPDSFINARVDNPYIIETDDNTIAGSLKTIFDNPAAPMYFFCANRVRGNVVRCIYAPNPI